MSWTSRGRAHDGFRSALAHDEATRPKTRHEHAHGLESTTSRYIAIAPFLVFVLLTGMRLEEAIVVEWENVRLDAKRHDGSPTGTIDILASGTKTQEPRTIDLTVSPALHALLSALRPKGKATGRVFPRVTYAGACTTARRLRSKFGAPAEFTWHVLRKTCSTYLVSSPNIFSAASVFRSSKQLGHSVTVAGTYYTGVAPADHEARTLEAAMGITRHMGDVIRRSRGANAT